jgi:hypothetical protein
MKLATHASLAFNEALAETLRRLTREVERALGEELVGLALGGGYGRGEGGVVHVDGQERPYNDLDLFLVLASSGSPSRGTARALEEISSGYAAELGIHVDFSRPFTVAEMRAWPATLMWNEFVAGHVVLSGPEDLVTANASPASRGPVPATEAIRLLLNRGAGLVWGLRVLRGLEPSPDPDFLRRNRRKADLALGEALLIAYGRHQTAYEGRADALEALAADKPELSLSSSSSSLVPLQRYREALDFKFRPDGAPAETIEELQRAFDTSAGHWVRVLLHVEARRVGRPWTSPSAYAAWRGPREPGVPFRKILAAVPANILRGASVGRVSFWHPREQLYGEAMMLLSEGPDGAGGDWPLRSTRFMRAWMRFN